MEQKVFTQPSGHFYKGGAVRVEIAQFRAVAMESASIYYKHLDKCGKGVISVEVRSIQPVGNAFLLKLRTRLFQGNALECLMFDFHGTRYTSAQIRPTEYDGEHAHLLVQPAPELCVAFSMLKPSELTILSDLKFLVKRVEDWYRSYGEKIALPPTPVPPKLVFSPLSGTSSAEQSEAVFGALSHPFAYIWGAPGTGKTRSVLCSCVLSLALAGRRLLLVAPTNNALEQMLNGILPPVLDAGFAQRSVLRLGVPSPGFANRYPEVCEVRGLDQQINAMSHERDLMEKSLKYRAFAKDLHLYSDRLQQITSLLSELDQKNSQNSSVQCLLTEKIESRVTQLSVTQADLNQFAVEVAKTRQRLASISAGPFAFLRSTARQRTQITLDAVMARMSECSAKRTLLDQELISLSQQSSDCDANRAETIRAGTALLSKLVAYSAFWSPLQRAARLLSYPSYLNHMPTLAHTVASGIDILSEKGILYAPYEAQSDQALSDRITQLTLQIEALRHSTTEERMQSVQVVAATVDKFLTLPYPTSQDDFCPDHIFMDEAGYCSLIKGASLLSMGAPVTLLGDHMQLPPICEMEDEYFQNDASRSVFLWAQSSIYAESLFTSTVFQMCEDYLCAAPAPFQVLIKYDLTKTFRFGSALADVLASAVYSPLFHSAYPDGTELLVLDVPAVPSSSGRSNRGEAEAIHHYLNIADETDYAILSPYRKQISLLSSLIPQARKEGRIFTVHASQGREWDTLFFSVCDTDNKWFTDTLRPATRGKMVVNTAVSRAKKRLILVCDRAYWSRQRNQLIGQLVNAAQLM